MHELSIAQSILEIVKETLSKENLLRLKEVYVEIGELIAIVPDSLKFCYNTLIQNTEYKDSKLNIKVISLTGRCNDCNRETRINHYTFICQNCKSSNLDIIQGQELKISYIEIG